MRQEEKKKSKTGKWVSYAILIILTALMFWPTSRVWMQQGLMKIGLFKPALNKPVENQINELSHLPNGLSFYGDLGELHMDGLQEKVVFINFWATWCPPCRAEMPSIQVLYNKLKDREDILFLMVEIDGATQKAEQFMLEQNLDFPIVYPKGKIPSEWLSGAIPTTVILNKKGEIAARHEGMADYSGDHVAEFLMDLASE